MKFKIIALLGLGYTLFLHLENKRFNKLIEQEEYKYEKIKSSVKKLSNCIQFEKNPAFYEDGYLSIQVDTVIWMTKNLDKDHYNNGGPIPELKETNQWRNAIHGAWCYYNNDSVYGKKYGKLYNWYTIKDERGLCPTGWSVASINDWENLVEYYGGEYVSQIALKSDTGWGNTNGKNYSNFSALPGGYRPSPEGAPNGEDFDGLSGGVWWSSTKEPPVFGVFDNKTAVGIDICPDNVYRATNGWFVGQSVRCVKYKKKKV